MTGLDEKTSLRGCDLNVRGECKESWKQTYYTGICTRDIAFSRCSGSFAAHFAGSFEDVGHVTVDVSQTAGPRSNWKAYTLLLLKISAMCSLSHSSWCCAGKTISSLSFCRS